jgi:hypothetical protein
VLSEKILNLLRNIDIPLTDPRFPHKAFSVLAKERKHHLAGKEDYKQIIEEEFDTLSRRLDRSKIQESCSVRNILRTRMLANLLINEHGELELGKLAKVAEELKQHLYSLGPDRQYDAKRQAQILSCIETLRNDKDLVRLLKNVHKPYAHRFAEQIIRDTLQLPHHLSITDVHARRATLSAWLCTLRQNVGSCFATAPAIIVHDEQPAVFLTDIIELLGTGRIKRTFGGVEYSVPLSTSWGAGDLKKKFVVPLGAGLEESDIAYSPGLMEAFESAELFSASSSYRQKYDETKHILTELLRGIGKTGQSLLTSAEELIRKAIQKKLGITEEEIKEIEHRPKGIMPTSVLIPMQRVDSNSQRKNEAYSHFTALFQKACTAFKQLADNALLKSWEFSLASFAETKPQFTRWNLYSSLGLEAQQPGGIGQCIFGILKQKIEELNRKVQDIQSEYEQVYGQLKFIEGRVRSAGESELIYLKVEYQAKLSEFRTLEEIRDIHHYKANRISHLFDTLIDIYDELFPRYFQEVYDADMHDVSTGQYDDSPAGFRLLYKYGRSNTSQWTQIKNEHEFIECLGSFFVNTEVEIAAMPEMEGLDRELSEIITAIVTHIKTKEFLETALFRMAAAHHTPIMKDPLDHLDQIDKKPWAYTSGGAMPSLVSCYWKREQRPSEVSRWVENPMELLVFLIDTLKQIHPKDLQDALKIRNKSLLMHSPTHAFLLKPTIPLFMETWQQEAFTYTYVRDTIVRPMERFSDLMVLDEEMMRFLMDQLEVLVPEPYRHYFRRASIHFHGSMSPKDFRETLFDCVEGKRGMQHTGGEILSANEIDSTLFSLLPLFPIDELNNRLEHIYERIPGIGPDVIAACLEMREELPQPIGGSQIVSAKSLQEIAKALLSLAIGETSTPVDYHWHVCQAAREQGYALPTPLIFADTNWVKEEFGFVVNPGTGKLELWRLGYTGMEGSPMSNWEQWLNGSRRDIPWGVYTKPYEYSA